MPLYEYECLTENRRFEVIRKFSDDPLSACPDCGGAVRKLLSAPAIQFKGSGWYITDYARSGDKSGDKSKSSENGAGKSEDSSKAKSDSQADAKTSSKDSAAKAPAAPAKSD